MAPVSALGSGAGQVPQDRCDVPLPDTARSPCPCGDRAILTHRGDTASQVWLPGAADTQSSSCQRGRTPGAAGARGTRAVAKFFP